MKSPQGFARSKGSQGSVSKKSVSGKEEEERNYSGQSPQRVQIDSR